MTTDLPIPTDGRAQSGDPVRGVLIVVSILALVLVLGAGYASIQATSVGTAKRLASQREVVRGAPLIAEPGSADADGGSSAAAAGALAGTGAGDVMSHGRVEDAGPAAGMPPLPDGVIPIDYSTVALPDYEMTTSGSGEPLPNDEVFPPEILALEGERIALMGFMLPGDWDPDNRKLSDFIVSPVPPGCHFGTMPRADEWIEADAADIGGVEFLAYRIVRVIGTLRMGEEYDEWGFLMSLYRIEVERVDVGS